MAGSSQTLCKDYKYYNILTGKCEIFICSTGYKRVKNDCIKTKELEGKKNIF